MCQSLFGDRVEAKLAADENEGAVPIRSGNPA